MIRLPNEDVFDYQVRLCSNKNNYNLSWQDIADLIGNELGTTVHHDTLRKWWSNFSDGFDYALTKSSDEKVLTQIELQRIELEKERKKKQTIMVEYNKILREQARGELLLEEVAKAITRVVPPVFKELPVPTHDKSAVLGMGDIHFGKIFTSLNNEYSEEIFRGRMEQLLNEVVRICKKEGITRLHVLNCGDGVEGMALRVSQLRSLQMGFVDMVIRYSRFMVEWLNELSKHVEIIYHHVESSNHTEIRPLGTSAGQFPKEDMERVIAFYIEDMLADNERIEVIKHGAVAIFDVLDNSICALHGHQVKGKNVKNVLRDLSVLHSQFFDTVIMGHFHHSEAITVAEGTIGDREVIVLPSIMGSDEFSDSLMVGAKPGAKFLVYEEGKGRTIIYDIRL